MGLLIVCDMGLMMSDIREKESIKRYKLVVRTRQRMKKSEYLTQQMRET